MLHLNLQLGDSFAQMKLLNRSPKGASFVLPEPS
jgi:hypothetical protein